jgi:hypothetical protein
MRLKKSYDLYLILATTLVLFIISSICIYAMFYFKIAQIQQMAPAIKAEYMEGMNTVVAPFVVGLILLLGICIPKRLLSTTWLNRFALVLTVAVMAIAAAHDMKMALLVLLAASLTLQVVVLIMAVLGSRHLNFERKGYWLRVGSSLIHLGLILFILDLFFYEMPGLHLVLFWVTTVSTTLGMGFCFYSGSVSAFVRRKTQGSSPSPQSNI